MEALQTRGTEKGSGVHGYELELECPRPTQDGHLDVVSSLAQPGTEQGPADGEEFEGGATAAGTQEGASKESLFTADILN